MVPLVSKFSGINILHGVGCLLPVWLDDNTVMEESPCGCMVAVCRFPRIMGTREAIIVACRISICNFHGQKCIYMSSCEMAIIVT
jgi:hypothetical protein